MPFPEARREIYENNVLQEVLCQLRFPTILRIDSEVPARFQDAIRSEYPLFKQQAAPALPVDMVQAMQQLNVNFDIGPPGYNFLTEDKRWTLGITRDFITLSTKRYERWEEFKGHLGRPLQALVEVYAPAFFSRIGLRYRNLIQRSKLNLSENTPWSELLEPQILGMLGSKEITEEINTYGQDVLLSLSDQRGQLHIQHGLAKVRSSREQCYVIDGDFFTTKRTTINDAIQTLDDFNEDSRRLFHWCITDRLREAMVPRRSE